MLSKVTLPVWDSSPAASQQFYWNMMLAGGWEVDLYWGSRRGGSFALHPVRDGHSAWTGGWWVPHMQCLHAGTVLQAPDSWVAPPLLMLSVLLGSLALSNWKKKNINYIKYTIF